METIEQWKQMANAWKALYETEKAKNEILEAHCNEYRDQRDQANRTINNLAKQN